LTPWRDQVVPAGLAPPPVTATSPLLAVIDSEVDMSHPEFQGSNVRVSGTGSRNFHGTATTAVAAAPANGVGILGVWPGMRAVNLPLPDEIRCSDSARQIRRAVSARAAVINMSYGAPAPCFSEYEELQVATGRGIALVAAAGNEFSAGNEPQYPASLPHVLTVASLDTEGNSSFFSNANAAVDLSAPGERILTAVPIGNSEVDAQRTGYAFLDGTSFSSPMVAAAVAWVRAARPRLTPDQAVQAVRLSAQDVDREGYDANSGFGLLRVDRALQHPTPPRDTREPNDDRRWIDGSRFGSAYPALYRTGRSKKVSALADYYEDPRDVYRVVVPARRRVSIALKPRFGDVDLTVHDRAATTVTSRRNRIAASSRDGTRTDTVTVTNRGRSGRTVWVTASIDGGARSLDSAYTLTVTRR